MSSREIHLPYLKVLFAGHGATASDSLRELAEVARAGGAEIDEAAELTVEDAYLAIANGIARDDPADTAAAAHAFVLGLQLTGDDAPRSGLSALGEALVAPHVPDPATTAEVLGGVLVDVMASGRITQAHMVELEASFGGTLVVSGDFDEGTFAMNGSASWLVAMVLDFTIAFGPEARCSTSTVTEQVNGQDVPVTVVSMETCTNLSFASAARGIDPRQWPDLNPFFKQVEVLRPQPEPPEGPWCGVIQEVVGPALNASLYTTNLDVTFLEDTGMASTAYDLTPDDPQLKADDARVDVDRGFLAVTDEGAHRRIQVTKIFHIEDLEIAHTWVCPLWAWQIVIAGWIGT